MKIREAKVREIEAIVEVLPEDERWQMAGESMLGFLNVGRPHVSYFAGGVSIDGESHVALNSSGMKILLGTRRPAPGAYPVKITVEPLNDSV